MLWLSKKGNLYEILLWKYSLYKEDFLFRYEPIKYTKPKVKEQLIMSKLFCRPQNNLKVGDKLEICWKEYIFMEASDFTDTLGKHIECTIRQSKSIYHTSVSVKTDNLVQPNYDPILKEYVGTREQTESIYSVLIDPVESAKNAFINVIDAGKMENIVYVMTMDLDMNIHKNAKISFDETVYNVSWIVKLPYQILVWLDKSVKNYEQ